MTSLIKNECFINGVQYKCRTCFDPGQTVYPLTDEANSTKTWRDLLKDVAPLQTNDDSLLPSTMCCICSEKLQSSYDFILQIHNVNNKYSKLLEECNEMYTSTDCLAESTIDLPLKVVMPEIKLEDELVNPYEMVLNNNELGEIPATIFKNEDTDDDDDDPFTDTYNDDHDSTSDQLEESGATAEEKTTKTDVKQPEEGEDLLRNRKILTRKAKHQQPITTTNTTVKISHAEIMKNIENVGKDSIVCELCSKVYATKSKFKRHLQRVHPPDDVEGPITCETCSKTFATTYKLKRHQQRMHPEIYKTANKPRTIHNDVKGPVDCVKCSKTYDNRLKFRRHQRRVHPEEFVNEEIVCEKCSKSFENMYKFRRHHQRVHPEPNQEINTCPLCSKEFKNKFYVNEHIKVVHDKIKPYNCSHCPKTFASAHSKRIHELSHTDDFPYACEWCDKRYRLPSKLKIHTEIHTTKPELLCPICKRSQKSEKDLEDHVKSHDDNRLQCPSCGNLFRRNSQLKDHYNAVHLKLRPYKCEFCELGFGDRKTRRMHERKYHPKERPVPT
ncbi:zinc finger protein 709-like [Calliphora vicina]|uniref:zinc finger protein 709-like n=1 Tax=Calliphora vicina TaxID=7373 RepID=UPI00325B535D